MRAGLLAVLESWSGGRGRCARSEQEAEPFGGSRLDQTSTLDSPPAAPIRDQELLGTQSLQ